MVIHTTITLTTSIIFLLLAGLVWRKRGSKDLGARALSLYAAMLFLWGLVQVSLYGGWFSLVGALTIRNLLIFAVPLIGLFFLDLSRLFLRLDNVNPIWWLGGIALVGSQIILDSLQPDIATPN
ncbi:MAG: hypothetical protein ACE5GO_12210, partial [Anaerolineales bacterium]